MAIFRATLPIPTISQDLSSSRVLSGPARIHFSPKTPPISIKTPTVFPSTIIRMGGGPRTYPGGVSKWQWKRMQAKKAKQLLKARLCRERQMYEMRKRAELKAAVSELERPWEVVERAPTLFSVKADEQLKALADRFQKPGGYDLWSERDGPQIFHTADGLPSARFFPKGVVHSVKPYGRIADSSSSGDEVAEEKSLTGSVSEDESSSSVGRGGNGGRRSRRSSNRRVRGGFDVDGDGGNGDLVPADFSNSDASGDVEEMSLMHSGVDVGLSKSVGRERNGSRRSGRLPNRGGRTFDVNEDEAEDLVPSRNGWVTENRSSSRNLMVSNGENERWMDVAGLKDDMKYRQQARFSNRIEEKQMNGRKAIRGNQKAVPAARHSKRSTNGSSYGSSRNHGDGRRKGSESSNGDRISPGKTPGEWTYNRENRGQFGAEEDLWQV